VIPTLGTGAELHGAFCLAAGTRAYLSQHVGDLETEEAMAAYRAALERYEHLFGVEPELVAHDLHPDFLTTRFAQELSLPCVAVQHHHAHVASVMAEHRLEGRVIGVAFDGFGLGTDGTAWGGEFLVCDAATAERAGHLRPVWLPGGDAAVRNPWRMALAHAQDAGVVDEALSLIEAHAEEAEVVLGQIRSGVGVPTTSSVGRLFDAVAALAGLVDVATYEGHPAIVLEQAAEGGATREYGFEVVAGNGGVILDARPIVTAVVKDLRRGRPPGEVAGRFHRTIAAATLEVCRALRGVTGLGRVCLSGGVFDNDLLTSDLVARLETVGFEVFLPREAPVGDGGIALGQVLVANASVRG
jgi:hydrogenase maturation protein HypF